ncbi:E-selectin [Perognathus longimembris pacificus]|uniref:E-selectin n=1 Tax=Perognathus longimembris pacificus TaxID=214514 RepID=UPI002018C6C8|nr:E-selectin [Perognathus longimembris pacificus]
MIASHFLSILTLVLLTEESGAWSYHPSTELLTYDEASAYCQQRYTHLVAIQNKEEIAYLNATLSFSPSYYWIGIRKVNGVWVWVGTQKPLTEEAKNWAPGEPNNKQNNEDCVEIYIKRQHDSGKWNDERCSKKKLALCYTAACTQASCNGHGECIETINNYTCKCDPGFSGLTCEQVVTCKAQEHPEHGSLDCTGPFGSYSYSSSCSVSCDRGYVPSSLEPPQCMSSGEWSAPPPACNVVECDALTSPANGVRKCSQGPGSFRWNTTCAFDCEEGYEVMGAVLLTCTSSGHWDNKEPVCKAVVCGALHRPQHGFMYCTNSTAGELTFKSSCTFACEESFTLQGPAKVECTAQGQWTQQSPVCEAVKCDAVSQPRNGFMNCTHAPTGEFTHKSSCAFHCKEGFKIHGAADLECTAQGLWTQEMPSCQVMQCVSLDAPEKMNMSCSGASVFGTVCKFACPEGWTLNGSEALTCGATGLWSGMLPTCEAPAESNLPLVAGLSIAGTSFLAVTSFLLWLIKRFWKKGKGVPENTLKTVFKNFLLAHFNWNLGTTAYLLDAY